MLGTFARFIVACFVAFYLVGLAGFDEVTYWVTLVGGAFIAFVVLEIVSELRKQTR